MTKTLATIAAGLLVGGAFSAANAAIVTQNSAGPSGNADARNAWLSSVGITAPQYLVDFESGYTNGQNVSGSSFAGGLVIRDTSAAIGQAIIRSGAGTIGGSNPVGLFSLTHNEADWLELDFSAAPIDYFGALDIDQAGTNVRLTFVGGGTTSFRLETTGVGGDTAEFFGIFRNDQPRIIKIEFDASGDGRWGLDNLEYGAFASVPLPGSLALAALGLVGLAATRGRVRRA
jgi:hypothetical protein